MLADICFFWSFSLDFVFVQKKKIVCHILLVRFTNPFFIYVCLVYAFGRFSKSKKKRNAQNPNAISSVCCFFLHSLLLLLWLYCLHIQLELKLKYFIHCIVVILVQPDFAKNAQTQRFGLANSFVFLAKARRSKHEWRDERERETGWVRARKREKWKKNNKVKDKMELFHEKCNADFSSLCFSSCSHIDQILFCDELHHIVWWNDWRVYAIKLFTDTTHFLPLSFSLLW